ncbi:hypothetical protein LQZ18_06915 [Lachnospiraceae bacterium ZAX-1]
MNYIAHRVNTIEELFVLDSCYGVEIDLRDKFDDRIYLEHDPFKSGDDFEKYLQSYHHGTMILNIKSERVEYKALELLEKYHVKDYFFLDSSFPMIKALSDIGNKNIALRFSEFEGMDVIRTMAGKIDWVWVDCFNKLPLDNETYHELKLLNYKICIVSPELQGQPEKLDEYAQYLRNEKMIPDAVCTKVHMMERWKGRL